MNIILDGFVVSDYSGEWLRELAQELQLKG